MYEPVKGKANLDVLQVPTEEEIFNMSQNPAADEDKELEENYFQGQPNDLRMIQEYNREDLVPKHIQKKKWGWFNKSIKLAFWEEGDEIPLFCHLNNMKLAEIMAKPSHKFTWEDYFENTQSKFLAYCDFRRGSGTDKHRMNERILQSTMIHQSIQGNVGAGTQQKRGGILSWLANGFS